MWDGEREKKIIKVLLNEYRKLLFESSSYSGTPRNEREKNLKFLKHSLSTSGLWVSQIPKCATLFINYEIDTSVIDAEKLQGMSLATLCHN